MKNSILRLLEKVFSSLKIILLAGLAIWLPIVVTFWLLHFLVNLLDQVQVFLPDALRPSSLYGKEVVGFGALTAILILLITGLFARNFIGSKILIIWDSLLQRIPIVSSVYNSVKQVSDTFFSSNSNAFREAVFVEFPRKDTWTIGFVTTRFVPEGKDGSPLSKPIGIFVPTTPNPTSGYLIWVEEAQVRQLNISIEEALKLVVSMGVVTKNVDENNKTIVLDREQVKTAIAKKE